MRMREGYRWAASSMFLLMATSCKSPAKPTEAVVSEPTVPSASAGPADVMVPFVGCASDGQQGAQPAPTGAPRRFVLSPDLAGQVAYYVGDNDFGVLGPKGWTCFVTEGSNGNTLYVSPEQVGASQLLSTDNRWKGFIGPAIELSYRSGSTSGRFEVARVIARLFPRRMGFVRSVITEKISGLSDRKNFPTGKYPTDQYSYKTPDLVEFVTPAGKAGFGTDSWLLPNDQAIEGMAMISGDGVNEDVDLTELVLRLSVNQQALLPLILKQVETDATTRPEE